MYFYASLYFSLYFMFQSTVAKAAATKLLIKIFDTERLTFQNVHCSATLHNNKTTTGCNRLQNEMAFSKGVKLFLL